MFDIALLIAAGLAAGLLNAVAGGGTFISLPALIYVGVPPVSANATATLTALPGYLASAWGLRREIGAEGPLSLPMIAIPGVIGSLIGSGLLIITPGEVFLWVVPWLLLLATILFAAGPWLLSQIKQGGAGGTNVLLAGTAIALVSVYGGYFNGGLGIMLLATFGLIGFADMHTMNGLKNVLSALLSLVSVVTFILAGLIAWEQALVMATSSALGGYLGAHYSRKITRTDLLRHFVTAVGIIMTIVFFVR
jgi:uncharacterized membrane protein YfcA